MFNQNPQRCPWGLKSDFTAIAYRAEKLFLILTYLTVETGNKYGIMDYKNCLDGNEYLNRNY